MNTFHEVRYLSEHFLNRSIKAIALKPTSLKRIALKASTHAHVRLPTQ